MMNKGAHFLLVIISFLLTFLSARAQCCSPGNPIGGLGNLGVLNEKSLKLIANYDYSFSGTYMDGTRKVDPYFVRSGYFNHARLNLGYGIRKKITVGIGTGYFFNKTQNYVEGIIPEKKTGYGFTNIDLITKYNIFGKHGWEITSGVGLRFPLGPYNAVFKDVVSAMDIQPSSGAVDYIFSIFLYKEYPENHLRFFMRSLFELKTKNPLQYKYGNLWANSLFVSLNISPQWDMIVQLRNEIRQRDKRPAQSKPFQPEFISISGSNKLFVTPQLSYSLNPDLVLSGLVSLPLFQKYNEQQLANTVSVSVLLIKKLRLQN